ENITWEQQSMNMYGKLIPFPRLTTWYGDNDKPYSFSGITLQPHAWNESLLKIKQKIEPLSGVVFNSERNKDCKFQCFVTKQKLINIYQPLFLYYLLHLFYTP